MASPENVQLAARFGLIMLTAGGLGLLTGTTLGRSGIIRRLDQPRDFYITCLAHLAVGLFCYFGQFFVPTS
jgi:hypothetical protein